MRQSALTGGGEAAHDVRTWKDRVANSRYRRCAANHGKTPANPGGLPIEVFDGLRKTLAGNRTQFYIDFSSGPFYGFNRPGTKSSASVIQNWWRQAMMGSAKAQYDGIKAFSETDFTEDLKILNVPTLVMHGDDDQIVPIAEFGSALSEAPEKGDAQGLQEIPAWHVHHPRRCGEPGPARLHHRIAQTLFL